MITASEAATILGIKPASVRWRCEREMFPGAINVGGRVWMIPREEVEESARNPLRRGPKPGTPRPPRPEPIAPDRRDSHAE